MKTDGQKFKEAWGNYKPSKTKMKKPKKIKCHRCGHERETKSKLGLVTCSNCGAKIRVNQGKAKKQ